MCHFHDEVRERIDIELEDEEIAELDRADPETEDPAEAEAPDVLADGGE